MPFTIIEYLSAAKPCIATDTGAVAEMLQTKDGQVAGVLVPLNKQRKPSKVHLKAALLQFIEDRSLVEYYGAIAKDAFEAFDVANMTKEYYAVYKKALLEQA